MAPQPIKIFKHSGGGVIKVYDAGSDWSVFTTGGAKYPETFHTRHTVIPASESLKLAAESAARHNGVTITETIK